MIILESADKKKPAFFFPIDLVCKTKILIFKEKNIG